MILSRSSAALLCLLVGACATQYADVPTPTRFEQGTQKKLQSARHWQQIADHFAHQLSEDLSVRKVTTPVYIPMPDGEQAFVSSFRELLTTALVAQGVAVSTTALDALVVDVRYTVLRFHPERPSAFRNGNTSPLASGLWIASEQSHLAPGQAASGPVPRSEIVLSASIISGSRILSRHSAIYYATDVEPGLYWNNLAEQSQGHLIRVSGRACEGNAGCVR